MELSVITPDGIPVTRRVHAAVLVCVKTAAIMRAVLALGSLKEEEYMRLIKGALEPKDRLVPQANCSHLWPVPASRRSSFIIEGKSFPPSERGMCWWIDLASSPSKRRRIAFRESVSVWLCWINVC